MLRRAVVTHSNSAGSKPSGQQPLRLNHTAVNVPIPVPVDSANNKRKFERTMSTTSNLGALHENVYFHENDFDDDLTIDLTGSPPSSGLPPVHYPQISRTISDITYPKLPRAPEEQTEVPPASSVPIPWSSSPPEPPRPSKRRTVPWLDPDNKSEEVSKIKEQNFTPLRKDKPQERYPWNKTASALRDEQKALRQRNKDRQQQKKPGLAKQTSNGKRVPNTFLSEEQKQIIEIVNQGRSVFFTGSAGTGKSVLMRAIIAKLRDIYHKEPDRIAVTASTGLAACNIEGITLHSFAGIGLGKEAAPELIKKIRRNQKLKQRWQRTKVLIIDEISMVDGDLFDKLEQIARSLRNNGQPFGGIQLVVTGDFFQLPPVPEKNSIAKFAFDAATWNTTIEHTILLTHVFRQKDPVFAGMLNEMRLGKLTPESIRAFQRLNRPMHFEDNIVATELFPTRQEVDNANSSKMRDLQGDLHTFTAVDSGVTDLRQREGHLKNFMAQETLSLKKGAQVMLIKNIDTQLVNGSLGKVIAFMDEGTFNFYKEDEEDFMRAHREGETEEEAAQNAAARKKFQEVKMKAEQDGKKPRLFPMVRFTLADNTVRTLLCQPEEWKTEAPGGEIVAKRVQVPLILAWALSIHKAQGQTLERVKVDLGKVFEKGQAYVALSRATSQNGLCVQRFDPRKVMVHPKVTSFYEALVSIEKIREKERGAAGEKRGVSVLEVDEDEQDEELAYMYG